MDQKTSFFSGDLEVLAVEGEDPHGPHVVLLHGYGASAEDLFSLSQVVNAPPNTTWLFPNAPQLVQFGPHYVGRSWFSFDMDSVERAMRQRDYNAFISDIPKGLEDATQLIEDLLKKIPAPLSNVVIGGFSQGAMLATNVALKLKEKLGGLAVFSGTLINKDVWQVQAKVKAGLAFFQSHGVEDTILNLDLAKRLETLFLEGGMKGSLHVFEDGHTIPYDVLDLFSEFLVTHLH